MDIHIQKNEVGSLPTPYTKIKPKWIKDLNVRPKTVKFLEENIAQKFHNIEFDNDFLDMTLNTQATREKTDKLDFKENLKFCASKDNNNSKKATHAMEESICKRHIW